MAAQYAPSPAWKRSHQPASHRPAVRWRRSSIPEIRCCQAPARRREMHSRRRRSMRRLPDLGGLNYWVDDLRQGIPLQAVAASFVGSPEFTARFGDSLSNAQYVDRIYENVLGREPEASGAAFWTGNLDNGCVRSQASKHGCDRRWIAGPIRLLPRWPALWWFGREGEVVGDRRERVGCGGTGVGESCAAHRILGRSAPPMLEHLKPRMGRYRPLMPRWSCSIRLFMYWLVRCRTLLPNSARIARG